MNFSQHCVITASRATVSVAASVRLNPSTGACADCRIAMGCVGVTPYGRTMPKP